MATSLSNEATERLRLLNLRRASKRRHHPCPECKAPRIVCPHCTRMICTDCGKGLCQWCPILSTRTGVEHANSTSPITPPERRAKVERRVNNNVRYPARYLPIVETVTRYGLVLLTFEKETNPLRPYPQYFEFIWDLAKGDSPNTDPIDSELDDLHWEFAALQENERTSRRVRYVLPFRTPKPKG